MNSSNKGTAFGKNGFCECFCGVMLPAQKLQIAENDKLITGVKSTWLEQRVTRALLQTPKEEDTTPLIGDKHLVKGVTFVCLVIMHYFLGICQGPYKNKKTKLLLLSVWFCLGYKSEMQY